MGLMFVVISMIMGTARERRSPEGISIFTTPTVVHFGAAIIVAGDMLAPWHSARNACAIAALLAVCGVAYMARVIGRTHKMIDYDADLEDRLWYNIFPFVAYGTVAAGSFLALASAGAGLFIVAAGVVMLMFVGIRNAWDIVTFIAVRHDA